VIVAVALVAGVIVFSNVSGTFRADAGKHPVPVSSVAPLPVKVAPVSAPSSTATDEGVPMSLAATTTTPIPAAVSADKLLTTSVAPGLSIDTSLLASSSSGGAVAAAPGGFDPSTSVPVSYGVYDTVYRNRDGSETKKVTPGPQNIHLSDGSWTTVKTTVTADSSTGGFTVGENPLKPSFPHSLKSGGAVTVDSNLHPVSITLMGASGVTGQKPTKSPMKGGDVKSQVVYPGVWPGQDLDYQVSTSAVKETIVLSTVPAASQTSWRWRLHAPGLTLTTDPQGNEELVDASGVVQYNIPTPVIWDSSGVTGESQPALVDVPVTYTQDAPGDWVVTLTPDRAWLTDPARVYPVSLDPSIGEGATGINSYESNGTHESNIAYIGDSRVSNTNTYWRTVQCYNYEAVFGYEVTGAEVAASLVTGEGVTGSYTGGFYAATAYSYAGAGAIGLSSFPISTSGVAADAPLQNYFNMLVNNQSAGTCFGVTGQEGSTYDWKQINTALYLNYEAKPTVAVSSPVGGMLTSPTPVLTVSATDPSGAAQSYHYEISTNPNPDVSPTFATTSSATSIQVPTGSLNPGVTYYWKATVADGYGATNSSGVGSFVTNSPGYISQVGSTPADSAVVESLTPTLTVPTAGTDANGNPLTYQFRVATGNDGMSGQVVASPVFPATSTFPLSWQVPAGVLQDGGAYTWTVLVNDGFGAVKPWFSRFTVDLRVTNPGPAPTDTAGPVTVNLANGNVSASFTSPTVNTVGGPMGLSFNYNSQAASNSGLTGSYYNAVPTVGGSPVFTFPSANPTQLVRTDSQLSFDWSTAAPSPGMPLTNFLARWTGFVTPPTAGSYTFGFLANDTAALYLNNSATATLNQASTTGTNVVWGSGATSMTAGPTPITVQYTDASDAAHLQLWVKYTDTSGNAVSEIVPATWFTRTIQSLPGGWAGSQPIVGDTVSYVSAQNTGGSVIFTDTSGATHTYTLNAGVMPGYTPPPGESGVVTLAGTTINFTDDSGTVYVFNASGQLQSATAPVDALKPAEPIAAYNASGQLASLSDPLSSNGASPAVYSRQVLFTYASATNGATGGACAPPSGTSSSLEAPPIGLLCQISYPDSTTSQLYYDLNGQLAELIDPGNVITNFGYTSVAGQFMLSTIRNSLANDWIAADNAGVITSAVATTISYDTVGRVSSVVLPSPNGGTAARPEKDYSYSSTDGTPPAPGATGTAYVDVAGMTPATEADGHSSTVTFNSALQDLTSESPSGLVSSSSWDSSDDQLTSIDPQGIESSTLYDSQHRATDAYGPAPSSCFTTTGTLSGSCPVTPAHSSTSYDGGLQGLNTVYYSSSDLTGAPTAFALGVGTSDGSVNQTWTGAPAPGVPATNFSAQLTGTILFPTAGNYTLSLLADDRAQVYINDVVVDNVTVPNSTISQAVTATAGEVARIRIVYSQNTGPALLKLSWTAPGTTTSVVVPGVDLSPDYNLVTSTHTDDSAPSGIAGVSNTQVPAANTSTNYGASPWLGQVASSSVDPSGLDLTSTATYESGAGTYGRQLTSTKPAGAATTTTDTYYGATQSYGAALSITTPVCGLPVSTPQSGLLETTAGPSPATGAAIATTTIYDVLGRVVGQKSTGDSGWTCTSYDARGRVTTVSYPSNVSAPARTVTNDYAVGGDPLTTSVSDPTGTITTVSDLLGRTTAYADVWGTVTIPTYNLLGQTVSVSTTTPGAAAKVNSFTYNLDGQPVSVTVNGTVMASPTYASGLLQSVAYSNGTSLASVSRDQTGAVSADAWAFPSQASVSDAVVHSQIGRVLADTLTDGSTATTSTTPMTQRVVWSRRRSRRTR
jgi:hypothetical protein